MVIVHFFAIRSIQNRGLRWVCAELFPAPRLFQCSDQLFKFLADSYSASVARVDSKHQKVLRYIEIATPIEEIQQFLEELGWIQNEQVLKIQTPGEGNMNVVLQVITDKRSFILKQSRPYVNKYQQIAAPLERILTEYAFYQATQGSILDQSIPEMLAFSPENYLMMLRYIEDFEDMTSLYAARKIGQDELKQLVTMATTIHASEVPADYPENMILRQLNHQHIFVLPFQEDNGFELNDVQAGLQDLSQDFKTDQSLKAVIDAIGQKYLRPGTTLLHGDYYPGSWIRAKGKMFIIDTEFSFAGFPEFDLGVMVAHLIMVTADRTYLDQVLNLSPDTVDRQLVGQVAGIEIARRLIGLAQLPLSRTLEEKEHLLNMSRQLILSS